MNASGKRSRAVAVVLVAAVHLGLIYLLTRSAAPNADSRYRIAAPPIRISFIAQPRLPLLAKPERLPTKPKLARIQVALLQPPPAFPLRILPEPAPSTGPKQHATGSPLRHGRIGQIGAPLALTIARYVAPVYPRAAARAGDHGSVVMALRVNAHWGVGRVKILHSSGSALLDRAAALAARRWTFVPRTAFAHDKPIWGVVQITFAPPQRLLGVSIIIMPYVAIAREVAADIARNRGRHLQAPPTEAAVRTLLRKLIAAFGSKPGQHRKARRHSPGESLEAQLAALGPLRTITFLGFVSHGVEDDRTGMYGTRYLFQRSVARWEVYAIKQKGGSSVWLVAARAGGRIEHIEVALQ